MVRKQSVLGNSNENRQPMPEQVIGHEPVVTPVPEPITIAGVQKMMRTMLDQEIWRRQRQLLQKNNDVHTASVV